MKTLITGCAGFIGYHLSLSLLKKNFQIVGIDNINDYYDINLKKARLSELLTFKNFKFYKADITNQNQLSKIFKFNKFCNIVHLAAQAGIQYSLVNPKAYVDSNLIGFYNILSNSVDNKISHLIYASSSSVYGNSKTFPFSESQPCSTPISFYAATKLSNEIMAHSFSHIYGIRSTGLRFFTVYGPFGRPDMSPFIFADSIINEKSINLYNYGKLKRDFTYIDDAVRALEMIISKKKKLNTKTQLSKIYNIGSNSPVSLSYFIKLFEKKLHKKAQINLKPLLKGDVIKTYADMKQLERDYNFRPHTTIEEGVNKFIDWYKSYSGFL